METLEFQQIIDLIPQMTIPVAFVISMFFLYKAGLLEALTSWIKKNPESQLRKDFYNFRADAETNHWHDIDDLKKAQDKIWETVSQIQKDISKNTADIANIHGLMNNGHHK